MLAEQFGDHHFRVIRNMIQTGPPERSKEADSVEEVGSESTEDAVENLAIEVAIG